MATANLSVTLGPQNGAPPSLEFVQLDRLNVDQAYQRATDGAASRRLIVGMLRSWEWPLCQPLVVARRDDGSLWVLDGQHRLTGARERGDIHHLPCVVLPALNSDQEALTFVSLNTRRQKLSQTDIFNGMLAAGDENAKATSTLIDASGWRIVRSTNTQGWKPGDLTCAPMIADMRRRIGEANVRASLTTLRQAYPDVVVTSPAKIIMALSLIYRPGGVEMARQAEVSRSMAQIEPHRWLALAAIRKESQPALTIVAAVARCILDTLDSAATVPASPASDISDKAPQSEGIAITRDRRWCEQCEMRVSALKRRHLQIAFLQGAFRECLSAAAPIVFRRSRSTIGRAMAAISSRSARPMASRSRAGLRGGGCAAPATRWSSTRSSIGRMPGRRAMGKRKVSPDQMGFVFDPPEVASMAAELAGLERLISGAVSDILHADSRSREAIAGEMSRLLDEDVSRAMLDAYASAAREGHKVPMSRFLALIAVTDRHDILDRLLRPIGAAVLVGEEVHTARLGHIDRAIAKLQAERKQIAGVAPLMRGSAEA